jgi:sigma-54 dependent transcriptional regulator, acetoin dehydrogenase operon transcriptional activator AcoR
MGSLANVREARLLLERHGEIRPSMVPTEIGASWRRCLERGLDPVAPPSGEPDLSALRDARDRHERTIRLARTEMELLHRQIAGSNFMIAFASPDGMMLDAIVDGSFRGPASARALAPGMGWGETVRGTNALGLAAALRRPAIVHAEEHFFRSDAELFCAAVPVLGPDGALAGVLDASSLCRNRQLHTRALVGMAAVQIENGLFRERHRDSLLLAIHGREEYLRTAEAGLLALSDDGHVLGISHNAQRMLHDLPISGGCSFAAIFADRFGVAMEQAAGNRLRLRDRAGATFFAEILNAPVRTIGRGAAAMPIGATAPAGRGRNEAPPADMRRAGRYAAARAPRRTVVPPGSGRRMVAEDPATARAVRLAEAAARRGLPLLIRGETGSGKEELARHAHAASGRAGAFVPVNCAALPGELVEAELFGYAEGAFTGARRGGAPGYACEADGGTLFHDEIGDMDCRAQAALLRLLDDWTVRPVGGGAARRVDVLLVAATNVPLEEAVAERRFRADLLHRLSVVPVELPCLAERQDFAAVARCLMGGIDPNCVLTDEAVALLARQRWDGNVRELRNVLTRASLDEPRRLTAAILKPFLGRPRAQRRAEPAAAEPDAPGRADRLDLDVARQIVRIRDAVGGSVSETARRLGVSRNRVYRASRRLLAAEP